MQVVFIQKVIKSAFTSAWQQRPFKQSISSSAVLLLISLLLPASLYAEIKITPEPLQGALNSSFELTIEAQRNRPFDDPDFSALNTDFKIINNAKSSVATFHKGQELHKTTWVLTLKPKRMGELIIPPLLIGSEKSRPGKFIVAAAQEAPTQILIESAIKPPLGYVRSAYVMSVRVLFSVPLTSAEITEPQLDNIDIIRLGNQTHYNEVRDGIDFQVIEQRYALFPLNAGEVTLPPVLFNGIGADGETEFHAASNQATFEALIPPVEHTDNAEVRGNWLAANELRLDERWSTNPDNLAVGDTVTHTLTIEAYNTEARWLPDVDLKLPASISTGAATTRLSQSSKTGVLVSRKEIRHELTMREEGDYTLPDINVYWWDVIRDDPEVSTLVGRTLSVQRAKMIIKPSVSTELTRAPSPPIVKKPEPDDESLPGWVAWIWAVIALGCAAGWSLTRAREQQLKTQNSLLSEKLERAEQMPPPQQSARTAEMHQNIEEVSAYNRLARACGINDPEETAAALILWGQIHWPRAEMSELTDIDNYAQDATLTYILRDLEHHIYEPDDDEPWQGDLLLQQINKLRQRRMR